MFSDHNFIRSPKCDICYHRGSHLNTDFDTLKQTGVISTDPTDPYHYPTTSINSSSHEFGSVGFVVDRISEISKLSHLYLKKSWIEPQLSSEM